MAETQRILTGKIPLTTMKRLSSLLTDNAADVVIDLVFGVDESGQANITGKVEAQVFMLCQRCMQPMELQLSADVSLAIVSSDYPTEQLPSYYEPLVVEDETVPLSELVEDELLLALPSVPLHDPEECQVQETFTTNQGRNKFAAVEAPESKPNPFAVLEQLRKKDS